MIEESIKNRYFHILKSYFQSSEEEHLVLAAELGRELVLAQVPTEEIGELHEEAIRRLGKECPDSTLLHTAHLISTPMMELLMAYGLAFRKQLENCRGAEEALEAKERYFRSLLYNMHEDIFVIDQNYRITDINNTALVTTGHNREDIIGKLCFKVSHRYDSPCDEYGEQCYLKKVFETGEPNHCQHVHTHVDGSKVNVDILLSPLKDKKGNTTHVVEAIRDVSDLMQAYEELRESEEKFRTTFDHAAIGRGIADLQGKFIRVNKAFCEIVGYSEEEFLLKSWQDITHPDDLERCSELGGQLMTGKVPSFRYVHRLIHKDGKVIWVDLTVVLIKDVNDNPVYMVGDIVDITEQKQLEAQFRQSQKMEAIGRLAGGVAHDFNNLLTVITGYSEFLLSEVDPNDPMYADLVEIKKAADRGALLTTQLLAFSRKQMMKMGTFNLNDVLAFMKKMLQRLIGEDIRLTTIFDSESCSVRADRGQIEQVIINLAVNARDAMPKGGKLTIETQNVELSEEYARIHPPLQPGHFVMLAMSDTGFGMDEKTRLNIFEPFFTTKPQGKGTGLGLSTVYGIVQQSGGHIWVYSELGQGTIFKIYLPRVAPASETTKKRVVSETSLKGTETILIVEDEDMVRELACRVLRRNGYTVLEARNAGEALLICEQHKDSIPLMVTDVVMPQMSGRDLAKRLSSISPEMKVIFVSGYTDSAIVHHGLLDEGVEFLQKPFSPEALLRKIRKVLDRLHRN